MNPLTKSGMYSKAGHLTEQLFLQLQLRYDVLKPQELHHLDSNTSRSPPKQQFQDPIIVNKIQRSVSQPFALAPSRDQLAELRQKMMQSVTTNVLYKPKYHLVFKKSPLYEPEEPTTARQRAISDRPVIKKEAPQLSDIDPKLPQRIPGFVSLSKQTKRKKFIGPDVNENRFVVIELPKISTKIPRQSNYKFSRQKARDKLVQVQQNDFAYNPKFTLIEPKTIKSIPDFSKTPGRKFDMPPVYTLDESLSIPISQKHIPQTKFNNQEQSSQRSISMHNLKFHLFKN